MEPIHDPLKDSFAFQLAEGEPLQRPAAPRRLTFDQVYPLNFHFYTAPFARAIVPLELVQAGDEQVVAHRRLGVHPMEPASIDFLVDFSSVTSVVADQIIKARRPLPCIRELFVLNHLGTVDQETLANLPGLESLSLGPGIGTQALTLDQIESFDWDADRLDLAVLEAMPGLRNLRFHALAIQSLEPLQHLHQLERLRIEGVPRLSQASLLLAGLTGLRWLGVEYMTGLQRLKGLENLERVEFIEPTLSNLKVFKAWKKVRYMLLAGRRIKSLEGIQALSALEELFLGRTSVADLAPLGQASSLRRLHLTQPDRITDFSPIGGLHNLERLIIDMGSEAQTGHLADIGFVTGLERLEQLEIIGAVIDDRRLEPLFGLPKLRRVWLLGDYGAQVDDLRRQKPECEVEATPLAPEPGLAIQVGPLILRKIADDFWTIFQDLSDLLGVRDNFVASNRVQQALKKHDPNLLARLELDPDADFVSIRALNEEDIRATAAVISALLIES
jgi:hypothetical protein